MKIKEMIMVSLFAALMAVGAFVRIPFPLIPITLQPFFCAFAGLILGSRLGTFSQLVYVVLGLTGVPIFSQGGGIMYIFKPSFGFLLGFIAGAYVIGKASEFFGKLSPGNTILSVMFGLAVIYAVGVPYMYFILKYYTNKPELTFWYAISINFPYFIKDIVLYLVVAFTSTSVLPALKKAGLSNKSF